MKGALISSFTCFHPSKKARTGPRGPWRVLHLQVGAAETDFSSGCSSSWPEAVAANGTRTEPAVLQQRLAGREMSWDGSQHTWGLGKRSVEVPGKQKPAEGQGRDRRILVVIEAGNKTKLGEAWSQKTQLWINAKSTRLLHFLSHSYTQKVPANCWNSGY